MSNVCDGKSQNDCINICKWDTDKCVSALYSDICPKISDESDCNDDCEWINNKCKPSDVGIKKDKVLQEKETDDNERMKQRYDYSKYIRTPSELGVLTNVVDDDSSNLYLNSCKNENETDCESSNYCNWSGENCVVNDKGKEYDEYYKTADNFAMQFARNGSAFFHYGDLLVNGPSKASRGGCSDFENNCTFQRYTNPKTKTQIPMSYYTNFKGLQPLGNKYFTKFYTCKTPKGEEKDRHVYIDNITGGLNGLTGNGTKASPSVGEGDKNFTSIKTRGLFPSLVENVYKINPMEFLNIITQDDDEVCNPYCIREIYQDENQNTVDKYKHVYMTNFDVENIAPNDFKNGKKEIWDDSGTCEAFTNLSSKKIHYIDPKPENFTNMGSELDRGLDVTTMLYFAAIGGLGIYMLHRLLKKKI